ncbi:MAG: hypothetical protein ABJA18_09585 [bacterium]
MKLCPQCDFIYEDDQLFCDMDGKELVHNSAPIGTDQSVGRPTRLTIDLPAKSRSRRAPSLVLAGVALTVLLFVVYFAQLRPSRSSAAGHSANQSLQEVTPRDDSLQPATPAAGSSTPILDTVQPEHSPSSKEHDDGLSSSPSPTQSLASGSLLASGRLAANPVAASAISSNSRGTVIVRLINGSSIKADEAWETKQGIWYRQDGVVTLLKRSQVRTIERVATPPAPSKSSTKNVQEKNRKATAARDRPRLARLEPADTKKQSRVASFLKKTGQILKRPFKL